VQVTTRSAAAARCSGWNSHGWNFPDCQAERLGGDIMLLSTLDKNHLSNLVNLHHTISELLIG
jgi:hypothetical protein